MSTLEYHEQAAVSESVEAAIGRAALHARTEHKEVCPVPVQMWHVAGVCPVPVQMWHMAGVRHRLAYS
jgi:hypothetical protein